MTKPIPLFEIYDTRFLALLKPDSALEQLCSGGRWSEGPVYFAEGDYLIWSDVRANRQFRWSAATGKTIYRETSNFSNGNYRDRQGRLITCCHGARSVLRTEADGTITTLVDHYQGKRFNSPNDVVVKSDGTIWFTDPPYGLIVPDEGYGGQSELPGNYVYRLVPDSGELMIMVNDMDKPNGLAFSPDERILYVADSAFSHDPNGNHHIRAYDVVTGGAGIRLINGRVFAVVEPGVPDGFRIDQNGYVFTSAKDGIQVFDPAGQLLGKILVPETVANCTFGGPDKNRLFIAATTSLYAITLNTRGVQVP